MYGHLARFQNFNLKPTILKSNKTSSIINLTILLIATEKISENMHIVANEPSMALYRIQEHVRKVLPPIIDKRSEVIKLQNDLQGHCYDMEYAVRFFFFSFFHLMCF